MTCNTKYKYLYKSIIWKTSNLSWNSWIYQYNVYFGWPKLSIKLVNIEKIIFKKKWVSGFHSADVH